MFHRFARAAARTSSLKALGLAGVASLALLAGAGAAQAQGVGLWEFGVTSRGGEPRVYLEEPRDGMLRDGFGPPGLPRAAIRAALGEEGLALVSPMSRNGRVYIAEVEDRRGRLFRVVVDARTGEVLERFARGGPPRPPVALGRDGMSREGMTREDPERFGGYRQEPPRGAPGRFDTGRADPPAYRDVPPRDGIPRDVAPREASPYPPADDLGGRRLGALPSPDEDGVMPGLGPQVRPRAGGQPLPDA
ncbi:MAG: hypothetical protein JWN93_3362, partial [Hyphomicrobiales bacterium]|nr:hypothetical protein [Hyphomicrobiales bacterium]